MLREKKGNNSVGRTRDSDGGSSIDDATVWSYTVPARRGRLHFETHSSVRGVLQLKVSGDNFCKRTWQTQSRQTTSVHAHFPLAVTV